MDLGTRDLQKQRLIFLSGGDIGERKEGLTSSAEASGAQGRGRC